MTYTTPDMVVSGVPYDVALVGGHGPADLDDFVEHCEFVLQGTTGQHLIAGEGTRHDDYVRFYEKSEHGSGKDVRVWTIRRTDGGFCAEAG